ncbi:MAG: hypothetical protein ABI614_02255 [Planctomycetota bacterium]
MSEKTLRFFQIEPAVIERVRNIANPATPIDNESVKDLAQAWLTLQDTMHANVVAIGQAFVGMPPILTFKQPEDKPAPK